MPAATRACAVCPDPARPGSAYCSPGCRNLDDRHDHDDHEGDDV